MKKAFILISVGLLNFLHGTLHIIQFIQSMFLVAYSVDHHNSHEESWIDTLFSNPFFAIFWAIVGILTFAIGIKDYLHHKKCDNDHKH